MWLARGAASAGLGRERCRPGLTQDRAHLHWSSMVLPFMGDCKRKSRAKVFPERSCRKPATNTLSDSSRVHPPLSVSATVSLRPREEVRPNRKIVYRSNDRRRPGGCDLPEL